MEHGISSGGAVKLLRSYFTISGSLSSDTRDDLKSTHEESF